MAFIAAGAVTNLSNSGAIDVPVPAGTVDGHVVLLLIDVQFGSASTEPIVPAEFGPPIWSKAQTAFGSGFYLYAKVAASEGANYSVDQGWSNSNGAGKAQTFAYSDQTATVVTSSTQSPSGQFGVTTITVPALTATAAGQLYVSFCWEYNGRSHGLTADGGGTLRGSSSTGALTYGLADESAAGAGSISGRTFTDQAPTGDYFSGAVILAAGAGAPVITGPTGAAGAASITHSALELQNVAGTWTATGSDAWSLTGTDAGLLTITGGVVTLTSGNFDYETKASYSFNVVRGSASQAVTLNITNVVEVSAPTKSTPTATSAIVGFTTDIAAGTAHAVLTLTNNQPSIAQIKAGQDHTGSSATTVSPADLTITSAGVKNFASVAVVSGTTRYGWIVHEANGIDSAVLATGPMYPGTGRPAAGVTASGGWTASTGADLGAVMAEDAPGSTAEFMSTPTLTGSFQDKDIPLTQPYPPGTYNNLRFSARNVGGAATARVSLLNAAGAVLATSGDQALTSGAFVTFTVGSVTITDTATQWRFSAKAP